MQQNYDFNFIASNTSYNLYFIVYNNLCDERVSRKVTTTLVDRSLRKINNARTTKPKQQTLMEI